VLRQEFEKFILDMSTKATSADFKKLCNVILANINTLAPLTTYQGQRSKKLVTLLQHEFPNASEKFDIVEPTKVELGFPIKRIKTLSVGPFRGFMKNETFDLDDNVVLVYGPNGSGKSSFCEALEYGLLGTVEEAEAKRLGEQDYLQNARVKKMVAPRVHAVNLSDEEFLVAANQELYRFCFVEKNRIDDFSRIAAKTPVHQTRLIASLFGLNLFEDFVRNFTNDLEPYIDLYGKKRAELEKRRLVLQTDEKAIKEEKTIFEALTQEEDLLAKKYNENATFDSLVKVIGTTKNPGRIQTIETQLSTPIYSSIGLNKSVLTTALDLAEQTYQKQLGTQSELDRLQNEVSYRDLYKSIKSLESSSPDKCPACDTPLVGNIKVLVNPYIKANEGLAKLSHLADIESKLVAANLARISSSKILYDHIQTIISYISTIKLDTACASILESLIPSDKENLVPLWWKSLIEPQDNSPPIWNDVLKVVADIDAFDSAIAIEEKTRMKLSSELIGLRSTYQEVVRLQEKRKIAVEILASAKTAISDFEEINKGLIEEAQNEAAVVTRNKLIYDAYNEFIPLLQQYSENLPSKLLSDLADSVKALYNSFNRNDDSRDLIADLKLPLTSGQRIDISFMSEPKKYFDALHVLSEGHIRCLGLSILLAKNLKLGCPFLLFDDPINAIDDDHRDSIRRTLFEDNYFQNTQIILACHGEEFYKNIQTIIGAERAKKSKRYTLLPHSGDNHINIDYAPTQKNYVVLAQTALSKLDLRDSLSNSRRALENLSNRIWSLLSKRGLGNLSIKLRNPKSPPELRNLVEQLRKDLSSANFAHENKAALLINLDLLLGVAATSQEWNYLNKGTHEDDNQPEFEKQTVGLIVSAITELDKIVLQDSKI